MSFLVGNKKKFIISILSICMMFVLIMIWSVFSYIYIVNEDMKRTQSSILAEQYKLLYEQERNALLKSEKYIDMEMEKILHDVGSEIKNHKGEITVSYLENLTKKKGITGIWLIEKDKTIRLSTEGVTSKDVTTWYEDRPEVNWGKKLDWLLNNEGAMWIDTFSKRMTMPHEYYKWAYLGLGEIDSLGGKVIVETGISVEDAHRIADLKEIVKSNSTLSENITNVEFVSQKPSLNETIPYEYQKMDNEHIITAVNAKDFNGDTTQIVLSTDFKKNQLEVTAALLAGIGASILTILVFSLIIATLRKKRI